MQPFATTSSIVAVSTLGFTKSSTGGSTGGFGLVGYMVALKFLMSLDLLLMEGAMIQHPNLAHSMEEELLELHPKNLSSAIPTCTWLALPSSEDRNVTCDCCLSS